MQGYNKTEKIIISAAALIFLLSGVLIFFGGLDKIQELASGREPIGAITLSKNDVRQKSEKDLNWMQAKGQAPVYEADSIFTGDKSQAKVHLKDGSQIGIDANSLVIISLKKDQAQVNLTYGNLWSEMAPNAKLTVTSGDQTYELRSADKPQKIRLSQNKSGALHMQVNEKTVRLTESKKKEPIIVTEPLEIADLPAPPPTAPPPVEPPAPIKLESPQFITPEDHQILAFEFPEETKPEAVQKVVDVSWTSSAAFKRYDWQLSTDAEFKAILQESQSIVSEMQTTALPSGTYWMRVRGEDQNRITTDWSTARQVTLELSIQEPQALPPPVLKNKNISYQRQTLNPRSPASVPADKLLKWRPVSKAEKYKVEVSKDLSFNNPQIHETKQTDMVVLPDAPGTYFYRVSSVGAQKISLPSEVGTVDVLPSSIDIQAVSEIEKVSSTPKPAQTQLTWTPVPGASSYTVELATQEDFSDSQKITFPENSGQVTLPKPGQYSVRVQALDESQTALSVVSSPQSISYKYRPGLKVPSLVEPFNESSLFVQSQKAAAIWLEWKKVAGASSYEVELATSSDFTNVILKKQVSNNRFLITQQIPLGKLYWRVRALSTNQEDPASDWTAHKEFTVYHQKNESFVK